MFFLLRIMFLLLNTYSKIKTIKHHVHPETLVPYNYKKINETEMIDKIFSHMNKQTLLKKLESKISTIEKLELIKNNMDVSFVYNMNNGGLLRDFLIRKKIEKK